MATLVFGADAEVCRWVGERVGMPAIEGATIGVAHGTRLVAGVVYNGFTGRDIQITCAASTPRWLTRGVIRGVLAYPFRQLGCARITAATEVGNRHTRRFLEKMGFRQEGTLREWFDTGDAAVYSLLASECRWLQGDVENVQQQAA